MQPKAALPLSSHDSGILRSLARRVDPADPGAQNNIGVLYYRRGMFDDAIAAFSRALALDERMRVARRNLEIAYGESGLLERRVAELVPELILYNTSKIDAVPATLRNFKGNPSNAGPFWNVHEWDLPAGTP